jgi:hypothetical protein
MPLKISALPSQISQGVQRVGKHLQVKQNEYETNPHHRLSFPPDAAVGGVRPAKFAFATGHLWVCIALLRH